MKLTNYLSIITIAAMFASCSTEGPAGPAGPTGSTGPAGPTGSTGPAGNANVLTQLYTVASADWSDPSSSVTWISTWAESDITDNNGDAVLAYWSNSSASNAGWLALPVTSLINPGDELSFGFNDNSITFSYYTGGVSTSPPGSTLYFKVTVVPPAVQHKYPGTNWQNAAEVQKIPEVQAALNNNR